MHNHGGKVLPEVPDLDTQLALSAKMIDKKTSTPKVSLEPLYGSDHRTYYHVSLTEDVINKPMNSGKINWLCIVTKIYRKS